MGRWLLSVSGVVVISRDVRRRPSTVRALVARIAELTTEIPRAKLHGTRDIFPTYFNFYPESNYFCGRMFLAIERRENEKWRRRRRRLWNLATIVSCVRCASQSRRSRIRHV